MWSWLGRIDPLKVNDNMKSKIKRIMITLLTGLVLLCGCILQPQETNSESEQDLQGLTNQGSDESVSFAGTASKDDQDDEQINQQVSFDTMHWKQGMELLYANQFDVKQCGEYYLITIVDNGRFLLMPENVDMPTDIPEDIITLQKPLKNVYLVSSSVFDAIRKIDSLDRIRFSSTQSDSLYIPEAAEAMNNGAMLFAGKYSAPDYELLLREGCDLAIENTMIYHKPETKEKLQELGIPVLVETSSYESHPFGRMEWIRLYGLLFDKQDEADRFFLTGIEQVEPLLSQEKRDCKVAFFYMNSNGVINVRKPADYIAKLIEMAGGEYVPANIGTQEDNALSTMNMQLEDFYLAAKDADVLIYNSVTTGTLESLDDLLSMNPLFDDFKAVKENRVYCTGQNFFQESMAIGDFAADLSKVIRGEEQDELQLLIHLEK